MRILVLGASGQLGHCIKKVAEERATENLFYPDEKAGNILEIEKLNDLFEQVRPGYVVNCAAYTAVDKAEDEVDLCREVNRTGAANIARLCEKFGATLIHISTDFVFSGNKIQLLKEEDTAEPVSIYGLTKLEGEQDIISLLPQHYILRTSWLYSEFGNNFVKTMIRLAEERDELSIIADQIGSPTYAIDLAAAILDIIAADKKAFGTYHYSNEGAISWFDFAVAIFQLNQTSVKVKPIPTSAYPTKAKRPGFSVMDKSKIKDSLGLNIPYWRDSLQECVRRLSIS